MRASVGDVDLGGNCARACFRRSRAHATARVPDQITAKVPHSARAREEQEQALCIIRLCLSLASIASSRRS